ncbi:MAG: hypothetical protein ACE5NG_20965 [bacterium]
MKYSILDAGYWIAYRKLVPAQAGIVNREPGGFPMANRKYQILKRRPIN